MKAIETRLGHEFGRAVLIETALTHKSFAHEHRIQGLAHNEKLEFLGDAVIDLVLGEYLIELFPLDNEGALSKKRASLVNEDTLAKLGMAWDIPEHLQLGKGEMQTGGFLKPRLLASTVEALVGALYLDAGFEKTRGTIRREFVPLIQELDPDHDYASDYKTRLQETAQRLLRATPSYELVGEEGPAHERRFTVAAKLKDFELARGTGHSKKAAEQEAAKQALQDPRFKGDKQ